MPAFRPAWLVAGLGCALAACSSERATTPSEVRAPTLDVAALVASMTLPSATATMSSVRPAPTIGTVPANCAYAAASQSFVCPPETRGGLTMTMSYTLLDAAGRPLATADSRTAATLRVVTAIDGSDALSGAGGLSGSSTVTHRQDMTLSGLLTETPTLDGTASTTTTGRYTLAGSAQPVVISSRSTTTTRRVVLPAATGSWPRSGTVTTDITTDGGILPQAPTMQIVTTFNGTSRIPIVITTGVGAPLRCTVDLASPGTFPTCG